METKEPVHPVKVTWRDWLGLPDFTAGEIIRGTLIILVIIPIIALAVGE